MSEGEVVEPRHLASDLAFQIAGEICQRLGVGVEVDEDEAAEDLDAHARQVEVGRIEVRHIVGVARRAQLAVEPIAPGMIGIGYQRRLAFAGEQLVSAVLADEPLAAGALVRPLDHLVRTDFGYYLLARQDREASPQAEAFCDWVRARTARE